MWKLPGTKNRRRQRPVECPSIHLQVHVIVVPRRLPLLETELGVRNAEPLLEMNLQEDLFRFWLAEDCPEQVTGSFLI